jgi:hypothetical protein
MRYFTVTIDVEPDCTPSWRYSDPLTFDGVRTGIRDVLQPLFNRHKMSPTYLINNVVLEDPESVETFRRLEGTYELATHLHSEFIEPEKTFSDYAGKKGEANQCSLRPEIELAKMENITGLFRKAFGYAPTAFRAGRFSAGPNTIRCLKKLGYKVDTSVTPHVNWNDASRQYPVDYRGAREQPYFVADGSYLEEDPSGPILEIPVSITRRWRRFRRRDVWLRPAFSTRDQVVQLVREYLRKYAQNDTVVLNMMFHNVEVIPGKSPYTRTPEECREYLAFLESVFSHCRSEGFESVTASGLYDLYRPHA